MVRPSRRFRTADVAQQTVGGFLLAGPFVVTEEVWVLAASMNVLQAVVTVGIVFTIGYGALYKADDERDPEREAAVGGVPTRFVSLMIVAFGSVLLLALAVDAPDQFVDDTETLERAWVTMKAVSVGAIFSVVGAATADTVF